MKYYKGIIFCSNPVTGFYRFEDRFQIYPLNSEQAPKSDKVKMHPLFIEYCLEDTEIIALPEMLKDSEELISRMTHQLNYSKRLLGLLSSLTNYRFYYPTPSVRWFAELPAGELTQELNQQSSKPGLEFYWYPELPAELAIGQFTNPPVPEVGYLKHPDCFMRLDLDGTEEVTLSEHISAAFHNYFALDKVAQEVVDSAISLICNGVDLRPQMKSMSFISFVSSIETMVNFEFQNEEVKKCETCHSEQYRVMGKFRDYLLKYASDNTATKKQATAIYKMRSKIAHSGMLLLSDHQIDWENGAEQDAQQQAHLQAMQISRVSLANWLLLRAEQQKGM